MAGADKQSPVIARGVLIDVAGLHGQDMLDDGYGIAAAELQEALARQGSEVRPGDVVLVRTGRMRAWPDGDRYQMNAPGLTRGGAEFLARAGAVIIGGDEQLYEFAYIGACLRIRGATAAPVRPLALPLRR